MRYDYSSAEKYAKSVGLFLLQNKLAEFDQLAEAHGFTQAQVDISMQSHLDHIRWLFSPSNYGWKSRIALAIWFLLGRKK